MKKSYSTPRYGLLGGNAGLSSKAIIFIDANNWYHNLKYYIQPSLINIEKLKEFFSKKLSLDIVEVRWYTSIPDIRDNPETYYKHLKFLSKLEKAGAKIISRKLQKITNKNITYNKEKGIDVWIAIDLVKLSILEQSCNTCILISGDADFVPALDLLQKNKIHVLSCSVKKGYSNELRNKFDYFIFTEEIINQLI